MIAGAGDRLRRVEELVRLLPHTTGVGLGWKETAGVITDTLAWRVYVRRKLPAPDLPAGCTVPSMLEGLPTDVLPTLTGITLSAELSSYAEPLTPGIIVSNLKDLMAEQSHPSRSGIGTLGFFALINGCRQRDVVLVSNRHVLLAHGAGCSAPIYGPRFYAQGESSVVRRDSVDPIADILDPGAEGNHSFEYPGEPAADYFIDCATARVRRPDDVTPAYRLASNGMDMELVVRRVARLHPLDAVGGRSPRVRKIGGATGLTIGRVVDGAAPVEAAGGPTRMRNLVIRGTGATFTGRGDSGALLIDDRDRAVGLIWGQDDRDPNVAYACHIHPVLHRLDVTMIAGGLA